MGQTRTTEECYPLDNTADGRLAPLRTSTLCSLTLLGHASVIIPLRPPPCLYVRLRLIPDTHSPAESTYPIAIPLLPTLLALHTPQPDLQSCLLTMGLGTFGILLSTSFHRRSRAAHRARFPLIPCPPLGTALTSGYLFVHRLHIYPYDMDNSTSLSSTVRPRSVANASLEVYSRRLWHDTGEAAGHHRGMVEGSERPDEVPAGRMRMENGERGDLQAGVGRIDGRGHMHSSLSVLHLDDEKHAGYETGRRTD
ncbi:hypothetical protein R3P38DRAFT_3188911 [Favolaschia claudopus]|uniref:Uncharacterized protein n=1 Tax=Favolaschia claudopus TaxID=2862362 RepID=A0AAW0BT63_9AGAR